MPLRRRDGGDDRRTFELVDTAGVDVDPDLLDAPRTVLLGAPPRGPDARDLASGTDDRAAPGEGGTAPGPPATTGGPGADRR